MEDIGVVKKKSPKLNIFQIVKALVSSDERTRSVQNFIIWLWHTINLTSRLNWTFTVPFFLLWQMWVAPWYDFSCSQFLFVLSSATVREKHYQIFFFSEGKLIGEIWPSIKWANLRRAKHFVIMAKPWQIFKFEKIENLIRFNRK